MAMALCPHLTARFTSACGSDSPSSALILVWACSSMRFSSQVSSRSGIFQVPMSLARMTMLFKNWSCSCLPLTMMSQPGDMTPSISAHSLLSQNILTQTDSVLSDMKIVASVEVSSLSLENFMARSDFLTRLVSTEKILPATVTGTSSRGSWFMGMGGFSMNRPLIRPSAKERFFSSSGCSGSGGASQFSLISAKTSSCASSFWRKCTVTGRPSSWLIVLVK